METLGYIQRPEPHHYGLVTNLRPYTTSKNPCGFSVTMSSSEVLTTSLSWDGAGSNGDSRLEDYLNDKLQTYADLESIDVLLRNVVDQQDLLRQQVFAHGCYR